MKKQVIFPLTAILIFGGLMVACSKSSSSSGSGGTSTTQVQTQSSDETQVSNEVDASTNDVTTSLTSQSSINGDAVSGTTHGISPYSEGSGSVTSTSLICDATVVLDTAAGAKTVTITYNGTNCWGNRTRTGTVVISIPEGVHWRDTGAIATVSVQNLKITRVADNKTITLNGTYTYTNVSGGSLKDLETLGTITHSIAASNLSINFGDSATRTWNIAKQRAFTYNNGLVITTTGTYSDGTNKDISEWGTNRYGNSFERLILEPMVIQQSCNLRLTSGQTETIRPAVTTDITYGLDANGDSTGCPGEGNYYYKAAWTIGGKTYTYIGPY
ncbi:MAG: hypothetical protein P4L51_27700 [Puia sp.]|nr:hypothetical protein [Puia sp.]